MSQNVVRRLRLHFFTNFHRSHTQPWRRTFASTCITRLERDSTGDYKKRVTELEAWREPAEWYPRLQFPSKLHTSIEAFRRRYEHLQPKETLKDDTVNIAGRINSIRTAGAKLLFLDLKQGDSVIQTIVKRSPKASEKELTDFKDFTKIARKGDWYQVEGHPHRSPSGELSISATSLPQLLAPSLHQIPEKLEDAETRTRSRHVDMLVNPSAVQTLYVRHLVEKHIARTLDKDGFTKVSTPILTAGAGGAVARPFETEATELDGQTLNLRIAPELWLKRLIVGGLDRVYEIGPVFRNEGVDATHNPEFSICEFYEAFATLDDLMARTESMLVSMAQLIERVRSERLSALIKSEVDFRQSFQCLEFIPTLEREMGRSLPPLDEPNSTDNLLSLFKDLNLTTPSKPTLPRLLDALASTYIEPLCHHPTFITHHPACMSPLSRHLTCPSNSGHLVSARAELFIAGREYANMYEEENSPFSQREKFEKQIGYQLIDGEGDGRKEVDESYLEALEWGLPPTGGWGCGVDRLVMLFAGRERMGDVLAFGGLRNVVGLGRRR